MEKTEPFYDYCVPYQTEKSKLKEICKELYKLGFRTIAIEEVYDHSVNEQKSKQNNDKKSNEDIFPEPSDIKWLKEEFKNKLRILQRLTIVYRNPKIENSIVNSSNLQDYDIIAARPMNDEALHHACSAMECDLISYDLEEEGPKLLRKYYALAYQRDIIFEIKYSPMFLSEACRCNSIKFAYTLTSRNRKKPKIIISSGALDPFHLRSPTDIKFMAHIFGLSEAQGKDTVNRTGQELFLQSASRRLGKGHMFTTFTGTFDINSKKGQEPQCFTVDEFNKDNGADSAEEVITEFLIGKPKKNNGKLKKKANRMKKNAQKAKNKENIANRTKNKEAEKTEVTSLEPPAKKIKIS